MYLGLKKIVILLPIFNSIRYNRTHIVQYNIKGKRRLSNLKLITQYLIDLVLQFPLIPLL